MTPDETKRVCANCKYMRPPDTCVELLGHIEVVIKSGWDGHAIQSLEIDEPGEFSCSLWEEKENE